MNRREMLLTSSAILSLLFSKLEGQEIMLIQDENQLSKVCEALDSKGQELANHISKFYNIVYANTGYDYRVAGQIVAAVFSGTHLIER